MPRKESLPIEERMQRAKELAELKQRQKEKNISILYASRIYKIARKTSIAFLWISQLILIDWLLPYRDTSDKIISGYFNSDVLPTRGLSGMSPYKLTEIFVVTGKGYKLSLDFPDESTEPRINDSITIHRSYLLNDPKKVFVSRINENFWVSNSITYKFFPVILIFSGLALVFLFIRNIEVKAFAWIVTCCTVGGGLFLIFYLIASLIS